MDILVVGGGGREHAIVMKLAESPKVGKLYCTPGNGGISRYAECFDVAATDIEGVVALAKKLKVDMVAVAPDDPLVLGMVDALQAEGFKTFGPKKNAAIIEGSKVFSKDLMKKYNIPTAKYEVFTNSEDAIKYVKEQNTYPAVIKADGLALGKGVILAESEKEAVEAIHSMIDDKQFGESSSTIVVEEYLTGPVSNPPYIPHGDIPGLDHSVKDYEPHLALDGGEDGLDFYRAISEKWKAALAPGGRLYFEVGIGQADAVLRIMRAQGFGDIQVVKDHNDIPRVVFGTLCGEVYSE